MILKMKNELINLDENLNSIFSSVNVENEKDKKNLFNALESCDLLLNDCVDTEIELKDIYVEAREVKDENGNFKTKYRTILFDSKGQTYATGSYGIFNILKKIIAIYGKPTWNPAIKVKVAKRPIGNGKTTLTLTLV